MSQASREPEILVAASDTELSSLGAEVVARAIDEAVRDRGVARIALSGGSTPAPTYRALAGYQLPWSQTEWYLVDERAVAPDHERSNFKMIASALDPAIRAGGKLTRMEAERVDREAAARDYEKRIRLSFGVTSAVALDVVVMGIGDDGHTASWFPGRGSTAIDDRLVAAVEASDGLEPRLTVTVPLVMTARLVVVLAKGAAKRGPILRALAPGSNEEVPARVLATASGRVVWVVDEAAAP